MLLMLAGGGFCHAQDVVLLENHQRIHVYNCRVNSGRIVYSDPSITDTIIDTRVDIHGYGQPIQVSITCFYQTADDSAEHRISISQSTYPSLLVNQEIPDYGTIFNATTNGGDATIQINCRSDSVQSISIDISWSTASTTPMCNTNSASFHIGRLTHNSATVVWNSGGQSSEIVLNGNHFYGWSDSIHITGLEPNTIYTVDACAQSDSDKPCCHTSLTFITNPEPIIGCPDLTDLQAYYVRGTYGGAGNPYANIGIIDTGYTPFFYRHHVCTDTNERDPRTGNQLRTVYPGATSSVRLGNPRPFAQGEALSYSLHIDTSYYSLLLLHYAAVLENPGHSSSRQPRFRLEIVDANQQLIDPVCGVADFYASSDLGWNSYEYALWKDWTTVGFDLSPYHGQDVFLRFTTRDCTLGEHFGYAYFCAECRLNSSTAMYCGSADSNTIVAPEGFNYLWYFHDTADVYSTERVVHFSNEDELLHCRLISTENPRCWVTLNTYAGHRWPLAIIDTVRSESAGCARRRVYFANRSTIVNDSGAYTGEPCETAEWFFGDNYYSSRYSTDHVYYTPGDYTVTLIVGIAGNQCRDTATFNITIPDYYIPALYDTVACDSMYVEGRWYHHDTLGPSWRVSDYDNCDTLYTLNMHIIEPVHTLLPIDTFCYLDTYHWRGQNAGGADTITSAVHYLLVDTLTAASGCDSLVMQPLTQLPPPPLDIEPKPDCAHKSYTLRAVTDLPYLHWSAEPHDPHLDGHESDSIVHVTPSAFTIYTLLADTTADFPCPAHTSSALRPVIFPSAQLFVNPEVLSYEQPTLTAHDRNRIYTDRHWDLVMHPGADTLHLSETGSTIVYNASDPGLDSLTVVLSVSNEYCHDTARRTVPFARVLFWAPNTFTPGEATNSRFVISHTDMLQAELSIYNRQGLLLYRTTDLDSGWDGRTSDGTPCPQAAYVWHLRYRDLLYPDNWQTATGTVTLLR